MALDDRSKYLRSLILRGMRGGRRGHYGSAASVVEILRVLYDDVKRPDDKVILSKGHGCLALYAILVDKGLIPIEELDRFCHKDGMLGGHPAPHIPGVHCHTGTLGHGLSIAVGMALAAKIRKQSHRIFVICGDGEIQEGSIWEACMSAAKYKLDNLTLIIDHNKLQSAGFVDDIQPLGNLADKFKAFGFWTEQCDGHDIEAVKFTINGCVDQPLCIIANTIKGKGISFAENNPAFHYKGNIDEKLMTEMEEALGYVV